MTIDAAVAVDNNARWCQAMCAAHDMSGRFGESVWSCPIRTPLWYPDAVALRPNIDPAAILAGIDDSSGASIKDSFADVDLRDHGYRVLFEAQWIQRVGEVVAAGRTGEGWSRIDQAADLAKWQEAWCGGDDSGPFVPALLADSAVAVAVVAEPDRSGFARGAVLYRSDAVVGVSNIFDHDGVTENTWAAIVAAAAAFAPGATVVGYESGPDLTAALSAGFDPIGGLRVWGR